MISIETENDKNGYILSEVIVAMLVFALAVGGLLYGLKQTTKLQIKNQYNFANLRNCQNVLSNLNGFTFSNYEKPNDSFTLDGVSYNLKPIDRYKLAEIKCQSIQGTKNEKFGNISTLRIIREF